MTAPGHRTSIIGTPTFVCRGAAPVRHRHDRSSVRVIDRQQAAIAERNRERGRRDMLAIAEDARMALWANCERRPVEFDR